MLPVTAKVLEWYDRNRRHLPWRDDVSPYRSLLSEFMLQQTQVKTVLPYFDRFLVAFPTVEDLAAASEEEVLSLWSGLGYYSRARNLHKTATIIVENGGFPKTAKSLQRLPGIGPYIAGAIASIAFGEDCPAVDGNHHRVFSRLNADGGDRKSMWHIAERYLPTGRSGDFNQALMDIGALICKAKAPNCGSCPLENDCEAHAMGCEESFPVKPKKKKAPERWRVCGVRVTNDGILIGRRPSKGLYGGLYESPSFWINSKKEAQKTLVLEWERQLGVVPRDVIRLGTVKHVLTHMRLHVEIFLLQCDEPLAFGEYEQLTFYRPGDAIGLSTLSQKTHALLRRAGVLDQVD